MSDYSPGSEIFERLTAKHGETAAREVWAAAIAEQNGDEGAINRALTRVKYGQPLNDSTASLLADQLTSDPLAAPAESLNNQLSKAVGNIFKNPMVLLLVVAALIGVVIYFGGLKSVKRMVTG